MPGGRPSVMDRVVATVDGRAITAAEQMLAAIRSGNYVETAAAAAGIAKETYYEWLRVGANARAKKGRTTKHEQRCIEFSDAVAEAVAASEAMQVSLLEQLARGGIKVETVTEKVADGKVLERTVKTEHTLPSVAAITWRLERRFAKRWGQRGSLELTGADGGAIVVETADARAIIKRELDKMAERMESAAPPTPSPEDAEPETPPE